MGPGVIDARRNLSGVCRRWYPVVSELHRFFIAISRAVVNHDDSPETAPDPLVYSTDALPERRKILHPVLNYALLPGPAPVWESGWEVVEGEGGAPTAVCAEDVCGWPCSVGIQVKWITYSC